MTLPNIDPQTRPAPARISYAAIVKRVAARHDFEVEHFESLTVTGQLLLEDAAALRALAALCERAERLNQDSIADEGGIGGIAYDIAIGYQLPPASQSQGGTAP